MSIEIKNRLIRLNDWDILRQVAGAFPRGCQCSAPEAYAVQNWRSLSLSKSAQIRHSIASCLLVRIALRKEAFKFRRLVKHAIGAQLEASPPHYCGGIVAQNENVLVLIACPKGL